MQMFGFLELPVSRLWMLPCASRNASPGRAGVYIGSIRYVTRMVFTYSGSPSLAGVLKVIGYY